jgi:hypothetical protein
MAPAGNQDACGLVECPVEEVRANRTLWAISLWLLYESSDILLRRSLLP